MKFCHFCIQYICYQFCFAGARFVSTTCNGCGCLLTFNLQHRCCLELARCRIRDCVVSPSIFVDRDMVNVKCTEWQNERLLHCINVWFYVMSPFLCALIILVRPVLPARIGTFHMPLISARICLFPVTRLLLLINNQIGNITLIFWHGQAIRLNVVNLCKRPIATITA